MADQELTYEQVVQAAERILNRNERVTIERVRRMIGHGDMLQIVGFLRQWQKDKTKKVAVKAETDAKMTTSKDEVVVVVGDSNKINQRHRNKRIANFSFERLSEESVATQSLFWSLYHVRQQKNTAIELHQIEKNSMTEMMMDVEAQIRRIKRQAKEEINQLMQQYCKISIQYEAEKSKLR
ncbi:DNA-binding protein [Thiotrichales bacterium 19S11-10]|nr:DNA-binding protein [Thiotrichales bacterium 19S11-10]